MAGCRWCHLLALLFSLAASADAWVVHPDFSATWISASSHHVSSPTRLYSTEETPGLGDSSADVFRTFLNQCCIQSFMFLLKTTRDPHTIRWLDNFTQPALEKRGVEEQPVHIDFGDGSSYVEDKFDKAVASELLRYHGLGAMNTTIFPTWNEYFRKLLKQPKETLVVETWDPRVPSFDVDINPASLCSRIISVREQIAREWTKDLGDIALMGEQIFASYWDEGEGVAKGFATKNLVFLEYDPLYDVAPSPLRRGNLDLLVLLTTQEAIHRLIREGVEDESPEQSAESTSFLRDFYAERIFSHFTGSSQRYHRADDFLEELMLSPPRMVTKGDKVFLINPLNAAELLLKMRDRVALEWQEIARETPQEHTEIRRIQLDKLMGI